MAPAASASRPCPAASAAISTAPATGPDWAMFDPTILMVTEVANPAAACVTSDGRDIRVSLRLASPPAASYVEMRTDVAEMCEDGYYSPVSPRPTVLAADGDHLLIHMVTASHCHEFYVYEAHPVRPSLRLLPDPGDCAPPIRFTGIACRDGEFVVAGFITTDVGHQWPRLEDGATNNTPKEVGMLSRFSSSTGQWEVISDLPIPHDPSRGLYEWTWDTDKLFAFHGHMFFVDYHRGMLFLDVFADAGAVELRFVPLPGIKVWDDTRDYTNGRQLPEVRRTVQVSQGMIRFVDVDDGLFGSSVTTWTLRMPEMEWDKDCVLQVDDLWSQSKYRESPLPRCAPEYPVVSTHDSGVVHFVVRGLRSPGIPKKAWMISVSTREMELQSYMPYKSGRPDLFVEWEEGVLVDLTCVFTDSVFICSDLCKVSRDTRNQLNI